MANMFEFDALELEPTTEPLDGSFHEEPAFDINAPYDEFSGEAWDITKTLLEARLGEYSLRNANYIAAPPGSQHPGFQEEFPVDMYTSRTGESLLVNLALKGVIGQSSIPVWMSTILGVVGRQGKGARVVFFEKVAVVNEPFQKWQPDLYTPHGGYIGEARAARAIKLLRLARENLYLPDWAEHARQHQHDDVIDVEEVD